MASTRSLDLFDYLYYKHIRLFAQLCLFDFFDLNYRLGIYNVLFFLSMCMGLGCSIYTVLTADVNTAINSSTCWGITLQGMVKYIVFVTTYRRIRKIVERLRLIFVANDRKGISSRNAILLKWSTLFVLLLKAFTVLIIINIALFMTFPLPVYLLTGHRELPFPILIPFVDHTTTKGYFISASFHWLWLLQVAVGVVSSDGSTFANILHLLPMADIIEDNFNQMNRSLEQSPDKVKNSVYLNLWIRNLVQMHEEYTSYVKELCDIYYAVFFFDVNANGLGLMMCIASVLITNYVPIYVLGLVAFCKLFMICFIGTLVENSSNQIINTIQNSNWPLMPVHLQKHILLMLAKSQRATILRAGTVPLNLDTFVNVLKNVYTVVMILLESIA